jgi:KpsF/GutQ family protein
MGPMPITVKENNARGKQRVKTMEVFASIKDILRKESQAVLDVLEVLDSSALEKTVQVISECRGKVIVSGCGTSAAAGKKIAHTFSCVECPALFLEPSDAVHGGLGVVQCNDIVILISKGGLTKEINDLIVPCKAKKAFVIGVTENKDSVLARQSDLCLSFYIHAEADPTGLLATSSIIATIAVFDSIAICVAEKNGFSTDKFALIHPGGAVGKKLKNKISN